MHDDTETKTEKKRNWRSWGRMLVILCITGIIGWGYEEKSIDHLVVQVDMETVLDQYNSEFALEENSDRILTEMAFHRSFSGQEGEVFYAVWQNRDGSVETEKYRIIADESERGYAFFYEDRFENLHLPSSRLVVFVNSDEGWLRKE